MKRVLFIGNGFDLAHKLKTKYIDFLYIMKELLSIDVSLNVDKEEYEILLALVKSQKNLFYDKDEFKNNLWFKHFLYTCDKLNSNWIDFESEIRNVCYDLYVKKNDVTDWTAYINEKYSSFSSENCNTYSELMTCLKKDLSTLIDYLNTYLTIIESTPEYLYSKDILKFYPTNVISFNYTSTFTKIYDTTEEVEYIHGKTSNNIIDNSIVLGFNGTDNIDMDVEFADFLKYYQMVSKNVTIDMFDTLSDYTSVFYGHSMDCTDSDIIKKAIEDSRIVEIFYYDSTHKARILKNLIKMFGEVEFRKLCLSKDKKIYFRSQGQMQCFNDKYSKIGIPFDHNYTKIKELLYKMIKNKEFEDLLSNAYFNNYLFHPSVYCDICILLSKICNDNKMPKGDFEKIYNFLKDKVITQESKYNSKYINEITNVMDGYYAQ